MLIATFATLIPILLLILAVSALFSAGETSLTAVSRGRMHQLERDGDRAAPRDLRHVHPPIVRGRVASSCPERV